MDTTAPTVARQRLVYVIDDDAMVRRSMSFALRTAHFDVRPFASGLDFVEDVPSLLPGCVLLDLRMPDMDGFAVLDALRDYHMMLPVVAMTGHGDVATAVRAMKAGARDFLEKPFLDDVLLEVLESAFQCLMARAENTIARAQAKAKLRSLTAREFEVLRALTGGLPNKLVCRPPGPERTDGRDAPVQHDGPARSQLVRRPPPPCLRCPDRADRLRG